MSERVPAEVGALGKRRPRRWLRRLLAVAVGLLLLGACVGASLWYHYFGRSGKPVVSRAMQDVVDPREAQLAECRTWFRQMRQTLAQTKDVQGILLKQERIEGRLEPVCRLQVKLRKQPLSLYLRWDEPFAGRELIFEMHKRTNRLLAHEGPPLRSISPDVLMSVDHPLALKFSRHPIHELSIQYILREMPTYLADAEANPDLKITVNDSAQLNGRACMHMRFEHPEGSAAPPDYVRFDIYLDLETAMPLRWERYGSRVDGEEQLDEYFELAEFTRNVGLTDDDFDPANEAYQFRPDWLAPLGPKPARDRKLPSSDELHRH